MGEAILSHSTCSSLETAQPAAGMFSTTSFCGARLCMLTHAFGQFWGNRSLFSSPNVFPLNQLLMVCSHSCSPGACAAQLMLGCWWCSVGGWSSAVLPNSLVQCVGLPWVVQPHRVQAGDHCKCSCFPWCPGRAAGFALMVPFGLWVMS